MIYDIFTQATGDRRRFSDNCSTCILNLLTDCGKLYFNDLSEVAPEDKTSKAVKVSEKAGKVARKVSIKTTKKSK